MKESLLQHGVDLMLYGMSAVVLFLAILVIATNVMAWAIRRYFPEPEAPRVEREVLEDNPNPGLNARTLAIIKAALDQHRANRG
jgi:oxaloacetate decarboxylase gamma subunit